VRGFPFSWLSSAGELGDGSPRSPDYRGYHSLRLVPPRFEFTIETQTRNPSGDKDTATLREIRRFL